jgi:hypothetical protein
MKFITRILLCFGVCAGSASFAHAAACPGPGFCYSAFTPNDFTNALSSAKPGDTIYLHAGNTFAGPFQLPAKSQTTSPQYITITTDALVASATQPYGPGVLPADGVRVSPGDKAAMPTITTPASSTSASNSAITTATSASYYRFVGIEFTTPYFVYNVIQLGTGSEKSASALPHHITFDRSYIHGSATAGSRRGIAANGGQGGKVVDLSNPKPAEQDLVFTNSYFADFNDPGADNEAIMSWNGYGPFQIVNNYLEAAGENLMFGGADPLIRNLVPSNITIKNNHFYKPLGWMADSSKWVKNMFELKNASGVWVENNVFENNWVNQQNGMGILLTPRNQNGTSRWSVVQHVTFKGNIINNAPGGFNILGYDDIHVSQQLNDVSIQNNLLLNIGHQAVLISGLTYNTCGATPPAQCGRMMQMENATNGVSFDHNTAFNAYGLQTGGGITYSWEKPNQNFKMTNNVAVHAYCASGSNYCGMSGDNASPGDSAISTYFTSPFNISYNVMYNGNETGTYTYGATTTGVSNNSFPGPANSPSDPVFATDYTQTPYKASDGVTYAGIDSTVWPIYSKVVQVTSDGGR